MAWTIAVQFDADKTNVGSVTATFTDTDAAVFSFTQRLQSTAGVVTSFTAAAIAARNAWQAQKTRQNTAVTALKAAFVAAGEVAT
jgi:hypothetical protein